MALNERQAATLAELRAKDSLTKSERGRLYALRLSGMATSAEDSELRRLVGANPLLPSAPTARSTPATSTADPDTIFDEHPDADGRAVRVLLATGVRGDQVARALRLLDAGEMTLDEARREAQQLRRDLPDLFGTDTSSRADSGHGSKSAKELGKAEAIRRGWRPPEDAA